MTGSFPPPNILASWSDDSSRWDNRCGNCAMYHRKPGGGWTHQADCYQLHQDPAELRFKLIVYRTDKSRAFYGDRMRFFSDFCPRCHSHESEHVGGRCLTRAGKYEGLTRES